MRAYADMVAHGQVAALKHNLRQADERKLALGASVGDVARDNALVPAELAQKARIKSIGRRFPYAAFAE